MRCEEVRDQFSDHVMQGAGGAPPLEVELHLAECGSCRSEAQNLVATWSALQNAQVGSPAADARPRFDRMLEAYRQGAAEPDGAWTRMNAWIGGWWPRQPAMQFGVALGLLLVGAFVGSSFQTATPPQVAPLGNEVAELRGELSAMREMVAVSLMQQQSASDRLRGVNWSYQLQQPGQEVLTTLLDTLMRDPNVNVRLATVDALKQFGDRPAVRKGVIDAFSSQDSPMMQVALIDLAVDLGEREYLGPLRQLTTDVRLDSAVRERARQRIKELE